MTFFLKRHTFWRLLFRHSQTEQRLVRATLKTFYEPEHMFLNLFKQAAEEYEFEQKISLTLEQFENLVKKAEKIREAATQDSPSNPPPVLKKEFDHCSKDGGSNV